MQRPVMPAPSRVGLREVREEDLPFLFAMRRDLALQSLLLTIPDALDEAALQAWIARRQQEPGGAFRVVEDVSAHEAVGYAQVSQVHRRNRTGYSGIALAAHARGLGLGQATLQSLIDFSRGELGLFKLAAEIRVDNFASIRCHLRLGFTAVGTLRAHVIDRDGARHDVLLLERRLGEA